MTFIDYCICTKNFSALDCINNYTKLFGHADRVRKMLNNMQGTYIHMTPVENVESIFKEGLRPSYYTRKRNGQLSISTYKDDHRDNSIDNDLHSYRKIPNGRRVSVGYKTKKKEDGYMRGKDFTRWDGQRVAVDKLRLEDEGGNSPVSIVLPNTVANYRGGTDAGESVVNIDDANKSLRSGGKVRIPFGAVSKENAKDYVPLMRDHSDKLDLNDTYTRRMYNLYNKKVREGFNPGNQSKNESFATKFKNRLSQLFKSKKI